MACWFHLSSIRPSCLNICILFGEMYILYIWFEDVLIVSREVFAESPILKNRLPHSFIVDSFLNTAGFYHSGFLSHKGIVF